MLSFNPTPRRVPEKSTLVAPVGGYLEDPSPLEVHFFISLSAAMLEGWVSTCYMSNWGNPKSEWLHLLSVPSL